LHCGVDTGFGKASLRFVQRELQLAAKRACLDIIARQAALGVSEEWRPVTSVR
jgi:hypothetical protein